METTPPPTSPPLPPVPGQISLQYRYRMLYRLMVVSSTPSLMAGVWVVRDWSLGMGKGGGGTKREKGGDKRFSHAER